MIEEKIIIAIDGFSSCGKSTLAKDLAKELKYIFIDSGAMYRGITLYALQTEGCITENEVNRDKLLNSLDSIELHFKLNPDTKAPDLYLNDRNVEYEIRTPLVSSFVSKVAQIKEIRHKLVKEQQNMGRNGGIVMDGRDIASVVFPNATLKLFITADIETRVNRRFDELIQKGISITREEVRANLEERDYIDSTRSESPLIKTDDAIVIDNTNLSRSQQLERAKEYFETVVSNDKSVNIR